MLHQLQLQPAVQDASSNDGTALPTVMHAVFRLNCYLSVLPGLPGQLGAASAITNDKTLRLVLQQPSS